MAKSSSEGGNVKRVRRGTKKRATSKKLDTAARENTTDELVGQPDTTGSVMVSSQFSLSIREGDIVVFLRQLIMLLEAGTPLLRSLQTLAQRSERQSVRNLISDIAQYVEMGNPLWQAFDRHPKYFDRVFVNLIKASEASGNLVPVLRNIVEYRERRLRFIRRVQTAMIYPVVVLVACYAVIIVIGRFVLPEFEKIFAQMDQDVPGYTKAFIGFSEAVTNPIVVLIIIALVVALVVAYKFARRDRLFRERSDRFKVGIPYVGPNIVRNGAIVDMSRTMSMLLNSGLSMMVTLDLTRDAIRNRAVAQVMQELRDSVERGEGMEETLRKHPRLIPPVVTDMMVTGEETGQLAYVTNEIAEAYEEQVDNHVDKLSELLPLLLVLLMGTFVLLLAIAVFVPMVSMIEQLGS